MAEIAVDETPETPDDEPPLYDWPPVAVLVLSFLALLVPVTVT